MNWPWNKDKISTVEIPHETLIVQKKSCSCNNIRDINNLLHLHNNIPHGYYTELTECVECGKFWTVTHAYDLKTIKCEASEENLNEALLQIYSSPLPEKIILSGRLLKRADINTKLLHIPTGINGDFIAKFDNGNILYIVDNIVVPDKWILTPELLSISDFLNESNIELRKRFAKIVGIDKMKALLGSSMKVENSAKIGLSLVNLMSISDREMGTVKMLCIQNPWDNSPYYLFVPPFIMKARDGIAWSFYQDSSTYNILVEA